MRILGLDYGEKRIGVALSDPTGRIAQPLTSVHAEPREEALLAIRGMVDQYRVEELVLGVPYGLTGQATSQTQSCLRFAEDLRKSLELPLHLVDERLTSVAAEKVLLAGGANRKKRRESVDKVAAALILQSHLDSPRGPARLDTPKEP